jgi:hypothetical protein
MRNQYPQEILDWQTVDGFPRQIYQNFDVRGHDHGHVR